MHCQDIPGNLRSELRQLADEKTLNSSRRFFKNEIKLYGVKTALVGKVADKYLPEIKTLAKKEVFDLCQELFKNGYSEESYIAADWIYSRRKEFQPEDFIRFESWLSLYIDDWAKCDTFCNHSMAAFIDMYPQYLKNLKEWARSENRWMRRASAVTLIIPAKEGRYMEHIFEIAKILLADKDDMVQKGYGWMLKAAAQSHEKAVFRFVMQNKNEMPRTALRYAIEKMPAELKKQAMAK
jgi:3-methyladenine DNA glycosylase AlkD